MSYFGLKIDVSGVVSEQLFLFRYFSTSPEFSSVSHTLPVSGMCETPL